MPSNNTLSFACLNCRSAAKKTAVIHELIHENQIDVLLLSEAWFTRDTPKSIMLDIAPDDFSSLHVVRQVGDGKPSRGGGLVAIFRDYINLRAHPLTDKFQPSTFELQLVRLTASRKSVTVMNVYRPQWMSSVLGFVDELANIMASLSSYCNDDVILCGDVNCPGVDNSYVDVELAVSSHLVSLSSSLNPPDVYQVPLYICWRFSLPADQYSSLTSRSPMPISCPTITWFAPQLQHAQ